MIEVGSEAPDFKLQSQLGVPFTLSEFRGKRHVMLVFYPLDWTPTWSEEIPSLEARLDDFRTVNTQVFGISVDSVYCHNNWAARDLGGVSIPLLADFHPKGGVASQYGVYLEKAGITDRATVIVDKDGIVRHASSVTPSGKREATDLLALCTEVDGEYGFAGNAPELDRPAKPERLELYFHHQCSFSRNVLSAMKNMRLEDRVIHHDVLADPKEMEALVALTGKQQVPCLVVDGKPMHESQDINRFLYQAFFG